MGSESFENSATVDRVTTAPGSISVFQLAATSLGRDSCCGEGPRPEEVGQGHSGARESHAQQHLGSDSFRQREDSDGRKLAVATS